jgi:hypothetical protein
VSQVTRDKVVQDWLAEAELAVQVAEQVVEAARRELEEVQGRLLRLRAPWEIAAEADAVVRERAGQVPEDTGTEVRALAWQHACAGGGDRRPRHGRAEPSASAVRSGDAEPGAAGARRWPWGGGFRLWRGKLGGIVASAPAAILRLRSAGRGRRRAVRLAELAVGGGLCRAGHGSAGRTFTGRHAMSRRVVASAFRWLPGRAGSRR